MSERIKILVADDHQIFREGLIMMLQNYKELEVVGQAATGQEVISQLKKQDIDIIVLDIEMPGMDGFETIQRLRAEDNLISVLVLSMHKSAQFIQNILRAGANGYLPKDAGQVKLVEAIHAIRNHGEYLDEDIARMMVKSMITRKSSNEISARELEVVRLISEQFTTKEIAEKMNLSKHTVESHRQNIMLKLGVKNTAGLVRYAIQKGIV